MQSITLSSKGQIVIPAKIRKKYGLKRGEKLIIEDADGYIKILPGTKLTDLCGSVKLDMKAVRKLIEEMRKEERY